MKKLILICLVAFMGSACTSIGNPEKITVKITKPEIKKDILPDVDLNEVIKIQLKCIVKQREFHSAMKLEELEYRYTGSKSNYRKFYRYRDSLKKYIEIKDSVERLAGIYNP